MDQLVIGVDVGTGSARAGVFDPCRPLSGARRAQDPAAPAAARSCRAQLGGHLAGGLPPRCARRSRCPAPIRPRSPGSASTPPARWWCATATGAPLSISTTGEPHWDTIVWLDHRAVAEAEECTASGHRVLDHVGGMMSPEMEIPKLMWLKRHLPRDLGARRPVPRSRRLPDLARQRQHRALRMHADLQVDLPRPRGARLAAGLPRRAGRRRPDRARRAAASAPRRSAAISGR